MKLAKSTLYSAISLAVMFGSAHASSETISMDSATADSRTEVTAMYQVDENHDGRTDRTLELEQSDSLA
jgi:hypothetical protein